MLKALGFGAFAISCAIVIGASLYAIKNTSGHTAANPFALWFSLVPLAAFGFLVVFLSQGDGHARRAGWLLTVGSLVGCLLPIVLTKLKILLNYEEWIRVGMPGSVPHRLSYLVGYLLVFVAALVLTAVLTAGPQRGAR